MTAQEQVEAIRAILAEPWTPEMDDEYILLRIRLVLQRAEAADPRPTRGVIEFDNGAVIELPDEPND